MSQESQQPTHPPPAGYRRRVLLVRRANESRHAAFAVLTRAFIAILGIQTCLTGAMAAFTPYDDAFRLLNPTLYKKLANNLSPCNSAPVSSGK